MSSTSAPRLSVVIATYNRLPLITRLLWQLAGQTLPPEQFEVVVVDDGSKEPTREPLQALALPYTLRVEVQQNAGAAAARHRGVMAARGDVVLVTDDDMQVAPDFLERHLAHHPEGSRTVVLGRIRPDPSIGDMPLFERWYAYLNNRMAEELSTPGARARGVHLFTGNVSFPARTTWAWAASTSHWDSRRTWSWACGWRRPAAPSSSRVTRTCCTAVTTCPSSAG